MGQNKNNNNKTCIFNNMKNFVVEYEKKPRQIVILRRYISFNIISMGEFFDKDAKKKFNI